MKVKTSVTLSNTIVEQIDRICGPMGRSRFIEDAVREELRKRTRAERRDREIALLNAIMEGPEPPDVDDFSDEVESLGRWPSKLTP